MSKEEFTIFIDTQDMEERCGEQLYQEYLEKENKELKEKVEQLEEENKQLKQEIKEITCIPQNEMGGSNE